MVMVLELHSTQYLELAGNDAYGILESYVDPGQTCYSESNNSNNSHENLLSAVQPVTMSCCNL